MAGPQQAGTNTSGGYNLSGGPPSTDPTGQYADQTQAGGTGQITTAEWLMLVALGLIPPTYGVDQATQVAQQLQAGGSLYGQSRVAMSGYPTIAGVPNRGYAAGQLMLPHPWQVLVLNEGLNNEAMRHSTDRAWMEAHGYTAVYMSNAQAQQPYLASQGLPTPTPAAAFQIMKWVKKGVDPNADVAQRLGPDGQPMAGPTWSDQTPPTIPNGAHPELRHANDFSSATVGTQVKTATANDMLTSLYKMPHDALVKLQAQLYNAGMYPSGAAPKWGVLDDNTVKAYMGGMQISLQHPDQTFGEALDAVGNTSMATRSAERRGAVAEADAKAGVSRDASISSTDALNKMANEVAKTLLGRGVTEDEQKRLTAMIHGKETANAQTAYDTAHQNAVTQAQGVDDATADRFVDALRVDRPNGVTGSYGISPTKWPQVLRMLNVDPNTPQTPDNERTVVKELALDYYGEFKNWMDVATAMYAGALDGYKANPPAQGHPLSPEDRGSLSPTPSQKAAEVTAKFLNGTASIGAVAGAGAGGAVNVTEQVDPQSTMEAELVKEHPVEYSGHEWLGRANDFLGMLGAGGGKIQGV